MMGKKKIQVRDIKVDVPEGHQGDWKIEKFTVSEKDANFHNIRAGFSYGGGGRIIEAGNYTKLMRKGSVIMSDTPSEIGDHLYFIHKATGNVLINGLGLGWVIEALFHKKDVETITVIEKSEDVINLAADHYKNKCPKNKKILIIHADAIEYKSKKGERYGAVWHDIWDNICADNLEEMKILHRKYGRRTDWQGSWCRAECEINNRRF